MTRRWPWWLERIVVPIVGPVVGAAVALVVAVQTYKATEQNKIDEQSYALERARYESLLSSIDGLLVGRLDEAAILEFLRQTRICGLYCPDEVVRAANAFTDAIPSDAKCGDAPCTRQDRERRYADLVLTIRRHLFATYRAGSQTALADSDIRLLGPGDLQRAP